jgi:hypothetical protein
VLLVTIKLLLIICGVRYLHGLIREARAEAPSERNAKSVAREWLLLGFGLMALAILLVPVVVLIHAPFSDGLMGLVLLEQSL